MKKLFLVIFLFLITPLYYCTQTKSSLADLIMKGAGGEKAWENSRYLSFTFEPQRDGKTLTSRSHLWDRYVGDCRFETTTPDKQPLLVLFNLNNKTGRAYINKQPAPDSLQKKYVDEAYQAFINDSYWLIAPAKLKDKGVMISEENAETIDGKKCRVLHLRFDGVGLTPGDQYWLYADAGNGRIVRWKFLLEGQKTSSAFNWIDYRDIGNGIELSVKKVNTENNMTINFPVAKVLESVEPQIFKKP